MTDDLRNSFTAAYCRILAWRDTRWLRYRVPNAATYLLTYQEIRAEVRPDWMIETRGPDGGRTDFLATVCERLGHGEVISVSPHPSAGRPLHPRLRYLAAVPHEPAAGGNRCRRSLAASRTPW